MVDSPLDLMAGTGQVAINSRCTVIALEISWGDWLLVMVVSTTDETFFVTWSIAGYHLVLDH